MAPYPFEILTANQNSLHERLHEEQSNNKDKLASSQLKLGEVERMPSFLSFNVEPANIKHTKQTRCHFEHKMINLFMKVTIYFNHHFRAIQGQPFFTLAFLLGHMSGHSQHKKYMFA
jgi:hypothetical protein